MMPRREDGQHDRGWMDEEEEFIGSFAGHHDSHPRGKDHAPSSINVSWRYAKERQQNNEDHDDDDEEDEEDDEPEGIACVHASVTRCSVASRRPPWLMIPMIVVDYHHHHHSSCSFSFFFFCCSWSLTGMTLTPRRRSLL